jgi:hypothetical protein
LRPVIHHAPDPDRNVAADLAALDVSRETVGPFVAGGQVPAAELVEEVAAEPLPRLSPAQIAKLEALTAQWTRDTRIGGPGPDDTLLYAAPALPPVPPARRPEEPTVVADLPAAETAPSPMAERRRAAQRHLAEHAARVEEVVRPARVSDWTSRHDPRSLEYAARSVLSRPVPLQDFLLPVGPVLDQGTTPPLSAREASACVGMAAAAAANILTRRAAGVLAPAPLMEEAARDAYALAQDRDHVSGNAYAGTSVLAGMKAGQELGWWGTYLWALGGTRDIAQVLLQLRCAVVLGIPWTTGMEEPDSAGVIRPEGAPAGGHALAAVGLKRTVAGRPGPYFVLQQSRGVSEGVGGLVYLHHSHLARLLAGRGEAAVPLPEQVRP